MVIIGTGHAGTMAAIELRNQGWQGSITLVSKDEHLPYERPPLSKEILKDGAKTTPVFLLDEPALREYRLDLRLGATVTGIDRTGHLVQLADGTQLPYEKLLLALGASPRKLNLKDSDTSQGLYLRTFAEALQLRGHLRPDRHILIVGGGFIGLEVAASAREAGCAVTIIEVAPRILSRGVPAELAAYLEARHRAEGVDFKIGVEIKQINNTPTGHTLVMGDGETVECDAYVVGIGAVPETALAAACGLEINNGVLAGPTLATSDRDIFTAGDCCSFAHPVFDNRLIRLEAWDNAQNQGLHAARSMLGMEEPYQEIPWFWSDQYDQTLQVVGMPDLGPICIKQEGSAENHLYFHFTEEGRLVGASGIGPGVGKNIRVAQRLIAQRLVADPASFARADLKLRALLR
jgi:3-phenylpropionate/trans-cinnamate dioxygenase ferredoxin reductase subunit